MQNNTIQETTTPAPARPIRRGLLLAAIAAFASAPALTMVGCNTVEGAGEDIEAAGDGISDAAD